MGFIRPTTSPSILQRSTIFTKINLRNAYNLVHIREGEGWKTEHYGYLVRPFQALVNVMLCYMLDKHIIDLFLCTWSVKKRNASFMPAPLHFLALSWPSLKSRCK